MRVLPRTGTALAAALIVVALSGCTDDEPDNGPDNGADDAPTADTGDTGDLAPGVPEECAEAFIGLLGPADLAEIANLPDAWPDPPVPATLCLTTETVSGTEEAGYATTASPEEVLTAYQAALSAAGLDVTRSEGSLGDEILYGDLDGVEYQITAREGKFDLLFAAS